MPIMTRMRESMPVILFGLLIAFLITIIFEWGMDYLGIRGGRHDIIGSVNGRKITYTEFSNLLRDFTENVKAQTGKDPDDAQQPQLREQVWQTLINQILVEQEIARMGLSVTDTEMRDVLYGENPPEELRRLFVDSTGNFHRDAYEQFLQDPSQFIRDPRGENPNYGTQQLAMYERNLREQRIREKLQSIIAASVRVTPGELMQQFRDQHQEFDASYAYLDAARLIPDSTVQVTDEDLKETYQQSIDQFKYEASRKLKYVLFREQATAADSAARRSDMEQAAREARNGANFIELVNSYSDRPDSGAFYSRGQLSPTVESKVFDAKVGDIVGPIEDETGLHLFKVLDERKAGREAVHAAHVLLPLTGEKDTNAVKTLAQSIARQAREGKDFAALAREYSKDPGSAPRGGDLGWFARGQMVEAFENAAFKARPGEVVGPIRTPYGLHIIKVYGHDAREVKVAQILMAISPSSQTRDAQYERARDFAANARETDISREAQQLGMQVGEANVQEKGGVIPGIGMNESAVRWAFANSAGTISEPYTVPGGYAVFAVAEVHNAGVRSFDEVKESLRPATLRRKKLEQLVQRAASLRAQLSPSDSLTKLATLDPGVQVQKTGLFTLGGSVPGIGRDLNFVGAVTGLRPGEISAPVKSTRGVYIVQLLFETPFDSSAFKSQEEALRSRLLQEKQSRFVSDWLSHLKDKADIEDNRDMFYR